MIGKKFHTRSFISFCLFFAIFWLLISGTVLYISPPGRVAHWQNWTLFAFSKDQWQSQHTIFSYLFIIIAIIHIFSLNWKNLWSYIKLKSKSGLRKKKEIILSIIFMLLVFMGTTMELPPFSSFYNLGEDIGFSWEEKQMMAPMPHTENLSIGEVASKFLKIETNVAISILRDNGIEVTGINQSLKDIAIDNGISPSYIYSLLAPEQQNPGRGGYGRMTIEEVAEELGIEATEIIIILKSNNIEASANNSIKRIADQNNMHPSEIVKLIGIDH